MNFKSVSRPTWSFIAVSILLSVFALSAAHASGDEPQAAPKKGWSFEELKRVPIQNGGRVKPLDSFAREVVLHLTGSRKFEGWEPAEMVLSIMAQPKQWDSRPLIKVQRADVKRQLMLDSERTRFSVGELFGNSALLQYAQHMGSGIESQMSKAPDPKANPREEELKRLLDRLTLFHNLVSGDAWTVVPQLAVSDRKEAPAWLALSAVPAASTEKETTQESETAQAIRLRFLATVAAYFMNNQSNFESSTRQLREMVEAQVPGYTENVAPVVRAETLYNRVRPFQWAWIMYLVAGLTFMAMIWLRSGREGTDSRASRVMGWTAGSLMVSAFLFHISGFALRCYIAGRPPVSNMYESIVWVSFGAVFFAMLIFAFQRQRVLLATGSMLGALGLIAADAAPTLMDPGLHPLVPVLRSNYWLMVHVLTITLGYAAFALTMGLGNVTMFQFLRGGDGLMARVNRMNQLTYRAMQFGVVLLAAGTILGGVWADYSWGRFWGWDPKEVWALIALLTYLAVLHGRFAGWVGSFGFAAWTIVCFASVVMAWYGVNFVLGVGLHSYGFSAGGQGIVGMFVLAQLIFVAAVAWVNHRRKVSAKS